MKSLLIIWFIVYLFLINNSESQKVKNEAEEKNIDKEQKEITINSLEKKTETMSSVRSILKNSLTPALYAASLLVGVVALLAFYESPVSPLPIPPLPDPPVGRFPPEHPLPPQLNPQQHPHMKPQQFNIHRNSISQVKHRRKPNYKK